MQPDQQQRILGYFIEEAKDHLNTIEQGLLNLQSTIADSEMVNEVFRAAHSVKGGAAMLGLNPIQRVAHRLEDFFKVLKETPVQVDQQLETLFLKVFDALQELLAQLQGPFGLTEEASTQILVRVEPVFGELEQHLTQLAGSAGGLAQPAVTSGFHPEATTSHVDPALEQWFKIDVPTRLREMLQLFKQPDSDAAARHQLQEYCRSMGSMGEQYQLDSWCHLLETTRRAIAHPDNAYRVLAPVVIKEIKQAQELVLAGRLLEIVPSAALQDLLPTATAAADAIAEDDFADLLSDADAVDAFDLGTDWNDSAPLEDELLSDELLSDAEAMTADLGDADLGLDLLESAVVEGSDAGAAIAPSRSDDQNSFNEAFNSPFESSSDLRHGPEVGMAELNSLADLFEGEMPELGLTWQHEDVLVDEGDLGAIADIESSESSESSDFSDLLFAADVSGATDASQDDFGDLFGDDLPSGEANSESAAAEDFDEFSDLLEIADEPVGEAAGAIADSELNLEFDTYLPEDNTTASPDDLGLGDLLADADTAALDADLGLDEPTGLAPDQALGDLDDLFGGLNEGDLSAPALEAIAAEPEAAEPSASSDDLDLGELGFGDLDLSDVDLEGSGGDELDFGDGELDFGDGGLDDGTAIASEPEGVTGLDAAFGLMDEDLGSAAEAPREFSAADLAPAAALDLSDDLGLDAGLELDAADFALDTDLDTDLTDDLFAESPADAGSGASVADPWLTDVSGQSAASTDADLFGAAFDSSTADLFGDGTLDLRDGDLGNGDLGEMSLDDAAPENVDLFGETTTDLPARESASLDEMFSTIIQEESNPLAADLGDMDLGDTVWGDADLADLDHADLGLDGAASMDDLFDLDSDLDREEDASLSGADREAPNVAIEGDGTADLGLETVLDLDDLVLDDLSDGESLSESEEILAGMDGGAIADDLALDGAAVDVADVAEVDNAQALELDASSDAALGLFGLGAAGAIADDLWGEETAAAQLDVPSDPRFGEFDLDSRESSGGSDFNLDSEFDLGGDLGETPTPSGMDEFDDLNMSGGLDLGGDLDLGETPTPSGMDEFDDLNMRGGLDLGGDLDLGETPAPSNVDEFDDLNWDGELDLGGDLDLGETPAASSVDEFDDLELDGEFDLGAAFDSGSALDHTGDSGLGDEADALAEMDDLLSEEAAADEDFLGDLNLGSAESADSDGADFADLDHFLGDGDLANAPVPGAAFADLEPELAPQSLTGSDEFADLETLLDNEAEDDAFAGLDDLLDERRAVTDARAPSAAAHEFADLESLLDGQAEAPAETASASVIDHEFSDLDDLLKDAEERMPGSPTVKTGVGMQARRPTRPSRAFGEQTMRVPVKHLDNLNNLVGELVVNRNSLEQDQERLRQSLDNLLYQVQQLSDVGQRMQDLYERSLLESSLLASRHGYRSSIFPSRPSDTTVMEMDAAHHTGIEYDPLEMDRFTGFHSLSQEMIELIVRVRESSSDIEFIVDETEQVTRMFRQVTTQLQEGLTRSRMVPFAQTADRLPRAVRDISVKVGKQADLVIEGRETLIDKMILEQLYDPMTHLVNNAITHGIEPPSVRAAAGKPPAGRINIRAFHQGNQTIISVSDDGAGIDVERVRSKAIEKGLFTPAEAKAMTRLDIYDLLFHPGFSTKDQADDFSGRGVGMDVVRTSLSEIRGVINTDSTTGKGTTFTIRLPLTLSISKALCCISERARIAFPMDGVEDMLDIPKDRIQTNAEGQPCIAWRDTVLPVRPLSELLGYNRLLSRGNVYGGNQEDDMVSIVVLRSTGNFLALQVDQVMGEQEIVIKQLEGPVPKPVGVAGATVLGDGRIMPIADVLELIDLSMGRIRRDTSGSLWEQDGAAAVIETPAAKTEPMVLIVDDSITVRELLSMTFNKVGYRVEQARDGQEAWEKLRSGLPCDIVFCDIEMPRMDGLELLSRIQKDINLKHLPIAMLTSRGADRHRQMAASLGASGYFTKPYLEEALLDAAQRMLKGEKLLLS